MRGNFYGETTYCAHKILIVWDQAPKNPRDTWDMCSKECRVPRRPNDALPLALEIVSHSEMHKYLKPCASECEYCTDGDACEAAEDAARLEALEALYAYADTSDLWDRDYGWTYVRVGTTDCPDRDSARKLLEGEIEVMRAFYQGEVFGWVVEGSECDDSCWGFYGIKEHEYMIQEAKDAIDHALEVAEVRTVYDAGNGD